GLGPALEREVGSQALRPSVWSATPAQVRVLVFDASATSPGVSNRPGDAARFATNPGATGQIPPVGKGRKLSGFCGKSGSRGVKCGKYGICKLRNSLFLRLSRPVPPEWGSGGRWFESSRPDM